MNNEEYFLREFNSAFEDGIDKYVLVGDESVGYVVINVLRESIMIFEKREMADYFIKMLLNMNVKIYLDTKDIPDWGTKEKQRAPDIYTLLKEQKKG